MKPILEIQSISKKFRINHEQQPYLSLRDSLTNIFKNKSSKEDFWALKDVNLDVMPGDTVGIIGKNGAGKSTLLKILSKITPPTSGKIISRGRIASLLEVGTGFHPELSGRENIFMNGSILGMRRAEIQKNFDAIVDFAGVEKFIDEPLKHYSSGMQLRLAFAVAAFLENEILIIDEVLAVGDAEFQKKCMGKMEDVSKSGRTILFVSHNLASIQSICTKGFLLEQGIVKASGVINEVVNTYVSKNNSVSNIKKFGENSVIKELSVSQINKEIVIIAKYSSDNLIKQPNFGFVIIDYQGIPITGTNPRKSGIFDFGKPKTKGVVEVSFQSPVLANGIYSLSVWFNDGFGNMLFQQAECLSFEIYNMGTYIERHIPSEGSIVPQCIWAFKEG